MKVSGRIEQDIYISEQEAKRITEEVLRKKFGFPRGHFIAENMVCRWERAMHGSPWSEDVRLATDVDKAIEIVLHLLYKE